MLITTLRGCYYYFAHFVDEETSTERFSNLLRVISACILNLEILNYFC